MLNNKFHILLLPHDRKINAKAGKSLMESLIKHGIFLRSDCGGKGKCGKCRVRKIINNGGYEIINACTYMVQGNIKIEIPESSIQTSHIISKPPVSFPASFKRENENDSEKDCYGIATDLGTTTIAMIERLKTDGMDGQGEPLFTDLEQVYELLKQAENNNHVI